MNAELTAMIEAGRKAAEKRIAVHIDKLPKWMREYADAISSYEAVIAIDLPGCAPVRADSTVHRFGLTTIRALEPDNIYFDYEDNEWRVCTSRRYFETLEEAVAFAADCGESYWAMRREAEQRNMAGITPHKDAPAMPAPAPVVDAQPDPLERIADALERIANRLENEVIYIARADVE